MRRRVGPGLTYWTVNTVKRNSLVHSLTASLPECELCCKLVELVEELFFLTFWKFWNWILILSLEELLFVKFVIMNSGTIEIDYELRVMLKIHFNFLQDIVLDSHFQCYPSSCISVTVFSSILIFLGVLQVSLAGFPYCIEFRANLTPGWIIRTGILHIILMHFPAKLCT